MNDPAANNPFTPPKAPITELAGDASELGGLWARLGAALLDGLIGSLLVYGPVLAVGAPALFTSILTKQPFVFTTAIIGALAISGLLFVALLVVTILFVSRYGQTIGKRIVGIRVVRVDGSKAGIGRIFWLRNVVNTLPSFVPLVGGIYTLVDLLFIFSESRRCLHDRIADTKVVRA
jgi:uncharacterized RDD family membrane protein YckC